MKTICLNGWHGREICVSEAGFDAIKELVATYRICGECRNSYTTDNPMVVQNGCLSCIVTKYARLTFVGPVGEPDEDGYQGYQFLDERGFVYLSSTKFRDEPRQDTYQTLRYWDFPVPTVYTPPRGEEVNLYPTSWNIYGDVQHASVLVIERSYDGKHTCVFLSYKNGEYRELTKRDSEMKSWLEQAIDIVEESKDEAGWYQLGGYPTKYRRESVVYQVVSQIASAVFDVKRRLSQDIEAAKRAAASDTTAS